MVILIRKFDFYDEETQEDLKSVKFLRKLARQQPATPRTYHEFGPEFAIFPHLPWSSPRSLN